MSDPDQNPAHPPEHLAEHLAAQPPEHLAEHLAGRPARQPMSDARKSGMVATAVLVITFALVGWFVWLAG